MNCETVDRQLHHFMHVHKDTMRRFFQNCGLFNGHPFHLFYIHKHPGVTQKELSDHLNVSAATVAVSIRRLESAGLVKRTRDISDKRISHLSLTEEGIAMDNRCLKGKEFLVDTLYKGFSPEELATLSTLIKKMTDNLVAAQYTLPNFSQEEGCSL